MSTEQHGKRTERHRLAVQRYGVLDLGSAGWQTWLEQGRGGWGSLSFIRLRGVFLTYLGRFLGVLDIFFGIFGWIPTVPQTHPPDRSTRACHGFCRGVPQKKHHAVRRFGERVGRGE